jgi:hypothetical protein
MQGPRINPVMDNLPLSTLKRKSGLNKTLARKTRSKIDTIVVDISDMAGKLASAFEVEMATGMNLLGLACPDPYPLKTHDPSRVKFLAQTHARRVLGDPRVTRPRQQYTPGEQSSRKKTSKQQKRQANNRANTHHPNPTLIRPY